MKIDNANILIYDNYDFDFFKASHTYPRVKCFCALNLKDDLVETEQQGCIQNEGTFYRLIDISELYHCLGWNIRFYLYQNNGISKQMCKETTGWQLDTARTCIRFSLSI